MSQDTRKTLIDSLHELILEGKKISIKSVAEKAGLSHSIIYNRYPELKCIIKEEQQRQADQLQINKERNELEKLKNKLLSANKKSKKLEQTQINEVPVLLAHIQQVYSMYDQLAEEHVEVLNKLRGYETTLNS